MERLDDGCFDERWREALGQLTHAYKEKCEDKLSKRPAERLRRAPGDLERSDVLQRHEPIHLV